MIDRDSRRRRRTGALPVKIRVRRSGAFFIAGTVFVGLAAVDADNNVLLLLFGLLLGAMLLGLVGGWRTLHRVAVTRLAPEIAVAGQPFQVRYTVTNHRVWTALRDLSLIDTPGAAGLTAPLEGFIAYLGPGESTTVVVNAVATRRGKIDLSDICLTSGFPFGVFKKTVIHQANAELVVFPSLGRVRRSLDDESRQALAVGAESAVSRVRGDDEFLGLREYRHGDNPRRIHWRRSAQTGQLMIREMAKTREAQIWCILDTCADPRNAAQSDLFETAVSACATILCEALETGARVGLICGGESLLLLPPTSGRHRRARLLKELSLRFAGPHHDLAALLERASWPARWRGPCLLFGAETSYGVRRTAHLLSRRVGPTKLLVPGTKDFDGLVAVPDFVTRMSRIPTEAAA